LNLGLNDKESQEMSEKIKEVNDNSFEHEVLQADKPVLVDFWAAWCGPCRMLAPTIEAIAQEFSGNASVVKLNVDDNLSVTAKYGIKGIPTLILFSQGKEVERLVGAAGKDSIARVIKKYTDSGAQQEAAEVAR
jgi:thioredoxin 1